MKSKALRELSEKGIKVLGEYEARALFQEYDIPYPKEVMVNYDEGKDGSDYLRELKKMEEWPGYPLFFKVVSPEITHKTDAGVVKRVVSDEKAVATINMIIRNAKKCKEGVKIQGVLASEDVSSSETRELFLGATFNEHFGHVISLGLGGIYVEVYKDVEFRVIPIQESDVHSMINRLKGRVILGEFRGMRPVNMNLLIETTLKLSRMIEENPEIREMDINPFMIGPDRGFAVDARIRIE